MPEVKVVCHLARPETTPCPADFTLGEVPKQIPAGAVVTVSVTFAPIGAGLDTGSVRIVTDDADASVHLHGGALQRPR